MLYNSIVVKENYEQRQPSLIPLEGFHMATLEGSTKFVFVGLLLSLYYTYQRACDGQSEIQLLMLLVMHIFVRIKMTS